MSLPHSWERSAERSVLPRGGGGVVVARSCYSSVCRVTVSPSLLQTNSKSSFSSSSLLLKAFKQQRLGCLPTWALGCQGNTYRWSPPSVFCPPRPPPVGRRLVFQSSPAALLRRRCLLSAKSFLCCLCCNMAWKGEQMGGVRAEGGRENERPPLTVAKAT